LVGSESYDKFSTRILLVQGVSFNNMKKTKKSILFIFIAYVWSKTLLGLAISPYKSVREVTRHKVLIPVVFSPLIGLFILFILGRMGSYVFELEGVKRSLMAITLSIGLIAVLLWQGLLLYLLLSFYLGLKKEQN